MAHWPVELKTQRLSSWFDTPAGRRLLQEQSPALAAEVRRLHGDSLLWLGCHSPEAESVRRCMVRHRFYAAMNGSHPDETFATFRALPQALPLPNHCVSGVVSHFALECVPDPRTMLRELSRVLAPGGRLLVFALNPFSAQGVKNLAARLPGRTAPLTLIRPGRLLDWLLLLGFELDAPVRYLGYGAALHRRWPALSERLRSARVPLGSVYYLSAFKQAAAQRPLHRRSSVADTKLAPAALPKIASRRFLD